MARGAQAYALGAICKISSKKWSSESPPLLCARVSANSESIESIITLLSAILLIKLISRDY